MPRVPGTRVPSISPWRIDQIAAAARRDLAPAVPADGQVDMMRVLEAIDGTNVRLPNGVVATVKLAVEDLPKHVLGETRLVDDRIFLAMGSRTYTMLAHEGFARFTAAHEIGHVSMHSSTLTKMKTLSQYEAALARATASHNYFVDSEFQANIFAAAFLAPDEGLCFLERHGKLHVDTVMKTFGMGRKAATARIENYQRRGGARPLSRHRGGR
jgi:hypothetical protein